MSSEDTKGALWIKKTKNGNDYYSVRVEKNGETIWVNLFWNRNKNKDNHPDFVTINPKQENKQESSDDKIPF